MKCNISDSNGHKEILHTKILEAEEVIKECLGQYRPEEIFISFNGGKDCTVLLHILDRVYKQKYGLQSPALLSLYVRPEDPFEEIEEFVHQCEIQYHINLITFSKPQKRALFDLIDQNPRLKAGFMGSRRTDPHCENIKTVQMTDEGWPQILRVSPLLNWSLADIWDYILKYKVSYCKLYDQGYTSVGSRSNTVPNPHLKYITENGQTNYRPAYVLKDFDVFERDGRF